LFLIFSQSVHVAAELFHVEGQTDRHDEANIRSFAVLPMHLKRELQYLFHYIIVFLPLNRFVLIVH
jgi:hypothetical protein